MEKMIILSATKAQDMFPQCVLCAVLPIEFDVLRTSQEYNCVLKHLLRKKIRYIIYIGEYRGILTP